LAPTNAGPFLPAPAPWLPIIAEGTHGYDLEYQLPTSALIFNIILKRRFPPTS
jgi:hypothetical protein